MNKIVQQDHLKSSQPSGENNVNRKPKDCGQQWSGWKNHVLLRAVWIWRRSRYVISTIQKWWILTGMTIAILRCFYRSNAQSRTLEEDLLKSEYAIQDGRRQRASMNDWKSKTFLPTCICLRTRRMTLVSDVWWMQNLRIGDKVKNLLSFAEMHNFCWLPEVKWTFWRKAGKISRFAQLITGLTDASLSLTDLIEEWWINQGISLRWNKRVPWKPMRVSITCLPFIRKNKDSIEKLVNS